MSLIPIGKLAANTAVNVTLPGQISQEGIAALLLMADTYKSIGKVQVRATLRTEQFGTEEIISAMPLFPLAEVSDIKGGSSYSSVFEKMTESATGYTNDTRIGKVCVLIPFGQVNVGGEDELSVDMTTTEAFDGSDGLEAWFVAGAGPEVILRYIEKSTGIAVFNDPSEVYVYRVSGDVTDKQLMNYGIGELAVTVRSPKKSHTAGVNGFWALTAASAALEATGTRRTVLVYGDARDQFPGATVTVNMTGSQRPNFSVFAIERISHAKRIMVATKNHLNDKAAVAAEVEASRPDMAQALQMSGRLASSGDLRGAVQMIAAAEKAGA